MRVIILTSTLLRHHYVVNQVAGCLDVLGLWQEEKSFKPESYAITPDDHATIAAHFADRDRVEAAMFAEHRTLRLGAGVRRRVGPPGLVNDPVEVNDMTALDPDVVLVFGTGLLKGDLLDRLRGRIINLHLGLSPYYRGAGTNFWPLVNREPEFVGATIHYLDEGIDTGPIIAHARPEIADDDDAHEIGNKAIVAGTGVLVSAARAHMAGAVTAVPQVAGGRLYQRKDFSAGAVRRLRHQFDTGMLVEYLSDRASRDARLSLVSLEAV